MTDKIERQVKLSIKVAKVIDSYSLVISKGSDDSIKPGQRFLIYSVGEEIIDPDSQESLGKLEIVKGTGKVTHIQPKMATIQSDMQTPASKTIRRIKKNDPFGNLVGIFGRDEVIEESLPTETMPFEDPEVNDIAKPI